MSRPNWERKLTAGQEARRIAGKRNQVRLRKAACNTALLKCLDDQIRGRATTQQLRNYDAERCAICRECAQPNCARKIGLGLKSSTIGKPIDANAQIPCGIARGFDETNFQHDLL